MLPLASRAAHERQDTAAAVAAESNGAHDADVKGVYANINSYKIKRTTPMPFHAALDKKTDAAHHLTRRVKLAAADVLVRCDDKMLWQSELGALGSQVGTPASQMRSESHHTRQTFDL